MAGEYCDAGGTVSGLGGAAGTGVYAGGLAGVGGRADGVESDTGAYVGGREYQMVAGVEASSLLTTKGSFAPIKEVLTG